MAFYLSFYRPVAYGTGLGVRLRDSGDEGGGGGAHRPGRYDGGIMGFLGCSIGIGEDFGPAADKL